MNDLQRFCGPDDVAIATALVREGIERGYSVSIFDGQEWVANKVFDAAVAINCLGSTGEDLLLFQDGSQRARFWLIYGNGDGTTISDHTDNLMANDLYGAVRPILERFG